MIDIRLVHEFNFGDMYFWLEQGRKTGQGCSGSILKLSSAYIHPLVLNLVISVWRWSLRCKLLLNPNEDLINYHNTYRFERSSHEFLHCLISLP